jgi:hypothetical protein
MRKVYVNSSTLTVGCLFALAARALMAGCARQAVQAAINPDSTPATSISPQQAALIHQGKLIFEAVVQIARMGQVIGGEAVFCLLRGKHGIPDRGRSFAFDPQSIQGELIFVDTAEQFYASDRDSGRFGSGANSQGSSGNCASEGVVLWASLTPSFFANSQGRRHHLALDITLMHEESAYGQVRPVRASRPANRFTAGSIVCGKLN